MTMRSLSSDLLLSTVCSSEIVFSTEASSSTECTHSLDQVDAGLASTVGTAERVTMLMQNFVKGIESKLLDAFKHAIADVIDHLAKDAATRVIMAERKAVGLEQELIHVKQQALATLLHLKQSTDIQIVESESKRLHERRRAEIAEEKLSNLQESAKQLQGELKIKGDMFKNSMQIIKEEGVRSSPLDDGNNRSKKRCKLEQQPHLDMDSLLLFAGVVCEDASKRGNGSMHNLPSSTCQGLFQAMPSLSQPHNKVVSNRAKEILLGNSEQPLQQTNGSHDAENASTSSAPGQQLLSNSPPGASFPKESSSQLSEMQTSNCSEAEQMLFASKNRSRKSRLASRPCLNGAKPCGDEHFYEADENQMHRFGVRVLDACGVFELRGMDNDNAHTCEDNVHENQANDSTLAVETSSFAEGHTDSFVEYDKLGNRAQKEEMVINDFNRRLDDYVSQNRDCCGEEIFSGCMEESSEVQRDSISSRENALCPDESESMELEHALWCLSEGMEQPGGSLVLFKSREESAAEESSLSRSPNVDACPKISCDTVEANKKKHEICGESGTRPSLTEVLQMATDEGQPNRHGRIAKERKVGYKGLTENSDNVLEQNLFRKPQASKLAQPRSSQSASLAVELSRDSRRLMQGARQLFLLAERKWR